MRQQILARLAHCDSAPCCGLLRLIALRFGQLAEQRRAVLPELFRCGHIALVRAVKRTPFTSRAVFGRESRVVEQGFEWPSAALFCFDVLIEPASTRFFLVHLHHNLTRPAAQVGDDTFSHNDGEPRKHSGRAGSTSDARAACSAAAPRIRATSTSRGSYPRQPVRLPTRKR